MYIATISGGKDSTAMCDLLLKNGYPVDYIIFNDTLDEFDEMYTYLDKVEEYFKSRYGKTITRLKPTKTYEEYIFHVKGYGNNVGKISGLPTPTARYCEWRRDSKIVPTHRWIKENNFHDYTVYIGFTTDETTRTKKDFDFPNGGKVAFPLRDEFKMSEEDCKRYLIENEMENPLYRHFNRTGCSKCQYQKEEDWFNVWKHYPKVWRDLKVLEAKVRDYPIEAVSYHIFKNYKTTDDLEKKFKLADRQGGLFDFDDEPMKDCFCKI